MNIIAIKQTETNSKESATCKREEIYPIIRPRVESIANMVRAKYGLTDRTMTMQDFFGICSSEGIELAQDLGFEFMAENRDVRGCFMKLPNGTRVIYLRYFFDFNESDPEFTAAHELGHYFLGHRGTLNLRNFEGPMGRDQSELEADLFAELMLGI